MAVRRADRLSADRVGHAGRAGGGKSGNTFVREASATWLGGMKTVAAHIVDVFTEEAGRGNRAAVVLDATGLTDVDLKAVASRASAPETAFGFPGDGKRYDCRVRYFSRTREMPICGHATIAFHFVRAQRLGLADQVVMARTEAGILPVEIRRANDRLRVVMTQQSPRLLFTLDTSERARLLAALGLGEQDLAANLPVQAVTTGHAKVLVPLGSRARLHALQPDREALIALSRHLGIPGYFVFSLDSATNRHLYHARMFSPATGIDEDPVTGNGNGPAGFYLAMHGALPIAAEGEFHYHAVQGEAMGSPGEIEVILHSRGGAVATVQVTGEVCLAGEERVVVIDEAETG